MSRPGRHCAHENGDVAARPFDFEAQPQSRVDPQALRLPFSKTCSVQKTGATRIENVSNGVISQAAIPYAFVNRCGIETRVVWN